MKEANYKTYIDERARLVNAELNQSQQFDKYILTLASGIFTLSILFIEKVAPQPEANTIWLLIIAWTSFGMSILSTLVSFLLSQKACRKQREILDGWYRLLKENKKLTEEAIVNKFADWTKKMNWISMFLFIIGVAFLISFSATNL